jgi:hypothetical protein
MLRKQSIGLGMLGLISWLLSMLVWIQPVNAVELPDWLFFLHQEQAETITPEASSPVLVEPSSVSSKDAEPKSLDASETPDAAAVEPQKSDSQEPEESLDKSLSRPVPPPLLDKPMKPEDTLPEIVEGMDPNSEAEKVVPTPSESAADSTH